MSAYSLPMSSGWSLHRRNHQTQGVKIDPTFDPSTAPVVPPSGLSAVAAAAGARSAPVPGPLVSGTKSSLLANALPVAQKAAKVVVMSMQSLWEMFRRLMARIARLFGAKVDLPEKAPASGEEVNAEVTKEDGSDPAEAAKGIQSTLNQVLQSAMLGKMGDQRYQALGLAKQTMESDLSKLEPGTIAFFAELAAEGLSVNRQALMAVEERIDSLAAAGGARYGMPAQAFREMLTLAQGKPEQEGFRKAYDPANEMGEALTQLQALQEVEKNDIRVLDAYVGEMKKRNLPLETVKDLAPSMNIVSQDSAKGEENVKIASPILLDSDRISPQGSLTNNLRGLSVVGGTASKAAPEPPPAPAKVVDKTDDGEAVFTASPSPFLDAAKRNGIKLLRDTDEEGAAPAPRP